MTGSRERQVARAMVSLADYFVSGDDPVDLLSELSTTAVRLLGVAACGVMLADDQRRMHVIASSSDAARTLELLQLQRDEGPCLDCYTTGSRVSAPDLEASASTWPVFTAAARAEGFAAVDAIPLRLRDNVLGVVGLFHTSTGSLTPEDTELAEALGHVAGITLVAQRVAADQRQLGEQLQYALDSRVVIEQSKGVLAASGGLDMDQAFRVLRKYARDHNLGLTAVARSVVQRDLSVDVLLDHVGR